MQRMDEKGGKKRCWEISFSNFTAKMNQVAFIKMQVQIQ